MCFRRLRGAFLEQTALSGSATQSQQWLLRPAFFRGVDNALLEKQEAARIATGLTWWKDAPGFRQDVLQILEEPRRQPGAGEAELGASLFRLVAGGMHRQCLFCRNRRAGSRLGEADKEPGHEPGTDFALRWRRFRQRSAQHGPAKPSLSCKPTSTTTSKPRSCRIARPAPCPIWCRSATK